MGLGGSESGLAVAIATASNNIDSDRHRYISGCL